MRGVMHRVMNRRFVAGAGALAGLGALALVAGCTFELGEDPFPRDAAIVSTSPDAATLPGVDASLDARVVATDAASSSTTRAPIDRDLFFCRVQPEVIAGGSCASGGNNCHANNTGLRLPAAGETDAAPTCVGDHPTSAVPASYYTAYTRSIAYVRATASQSPLYVRPQGRSHPVTVFSSGDARAQLLARWIEGTP